MILIYTTDKNHPRKVVETCQVNFLLCNDPLRHFHMLLWGSALALASRAPREVCVVSYPGRWWLLAVQALVRGQLVPGSQQPCGTSLAIPIFLFFLPTAPLERKEENQTQSLYHRHLPPLGPRYPRFRLSMVPRSTLSQSLSCHLPSCLPNLPFPCSSNHPDPTGVPGALPGPPSPTSLLQLPPISGPHSRRQVPLAYSVMSKAWQRQPKHHPLPKGWRGPHHWKGTTSLPAVQETAVVGGQPVVLFCSPVDTSVRLLLTCGGT